MGKLQKELLVQVSTHVLGLEKRVGELEQRLADQELETRKTQRRAVVSVDSAESEKVGWFDEMGVAHVPAQEVTPEELQPTFTYRGELKELDSKKELEKACEAFMPGTSQLWPEWAMRRGFPHRQQPADGIPVPCFRAMATVRVPSTRGREWLIERLDLVKEYVELTDGCDMSTDDYNKLVTAFGSREELRRRLIGLNYWPWRNLFVGLGSGAGYVFVASRGHKGHVTALETVLRTFLYHHFRFHGGQSQPHAEVIVIEAGGNLSLSPKAAASYVTANGTEAIELNDWLTRTEESKRKHEDVRPVNDLDKAIKEPSGHVKEVRSLLEEALRPSEVPSISIIERWTLDQIQQVKKWAQSEIDSDYSEPVPDCLKPFMKDNHFQVTREVAMQTLEVLDKLAKMPEECQPSMHTLLCWSQAEHDEVVDWCYKEKHWFIEHNVRAPGPVPKVLELHVWYRDSDGAAGRTEEGRPVPEGRG